MAQLYIHSISFKKKSKTDFIFYFTLSVGDFRYYVIDASKSLTNYQQ